MLTATQLSLGLIAGHIIWINWVNINLKKKNEIQAELIEKQFDQMAYLADIIQRNDIKETEFDKIVLDELFKMDE